MIYETRNAVRVFAFKDEKVVCIKYKNINKGYYDIPGGKIETNETEIEACIREFKEETGMDVKNLKYKGTVEIVYPKRTKRYILKIYIANSLEGNIKDCIENETFLLPIEELIKKDKRLAVTHLLDDKFYLKKDNLSISYTCDNEHKIIECK